MSWLLISNGPLEAWPEVPDLLPSDSTVLEPSVPSFSSPCFLLTRSNFLFIRSMTLRSASKPGFRLWLSANFWYLKWVSASTVFTSAWCIVRKAMTSCLTNGCPLRRAESCRWFASFWQQQRTKSSISGDQLSGSANVGAGLVGMTKMARSGCRFACGGAPSAISIAVIPKDQTSALPS